MTHFEAAGLLDAYAIISTDFPTTLRKLIHKIKSKSIKGQKLFISIDRNY